MELTVELVRCGRITVLRVMTPVRGHTLKIISVQGFVGQVRMMTRVNASLVMIIVFSVKARRHHNVQNVQKEIF